MCSQDLERNHESDLERSWGPLKKSWGVLERSWVRCTFHPCDVYLIFKHRIYVSFLESHLCRIRYHMRRTSHLLIAINTASASTCRIRRICGMQALSHLESPPLTSRWTASDKNRTLPSTPNFSDMLLDLGVPVAGKSRIRPYPSAFSPRNFLYRNYIEK